MRHVILAPGSGFAAHAFRDLIPALPAEWHAVPFDMGMGPDDPPPGFTWQRLVDRLRATVESLDGDVGFIGLSGGATLALAYVAAYPQAIRGLALIEPAFAYLPLTTVESDYYVELEAVMQLPPAAQREAFRRLLVAQGVSLPPPKPEWNAGYASADTPDDTALVRITRAMLSHSVRPDYLSGWDRPIYLAVGGRSHPMWRAQAQQIAAHHRRTHIEVFEDRHHLDTPLHAEVDRFVTGIRETWST